MLGQMLAEIEAAYSMDSLRGYFVWAEGWNEHLLCRKIIMMCGGQKSFTLNDSYILFLHKSTWDIFLGLTRL